MHVLAKLIEARGDDSYESGDASPEQLHLESLDSNNVGLAASSRSVPVQMSTRWHSTAHLAQHRLHDTTEHIHEHLTSYSAA